MRLSKRMLNDMPDIMWSVSRTQATIRKWAGEVAKLEAGLESIECGECGKNMLECDAEECDKLAEQRR